MPLYDLYAAGIALTICCAVAASLAGMQAMIAALAINLVPFLIMEFANTPTVVAVVEQGFLAHARL